MIAGQPSIKAMKNQKEIPNVSKDFSKGNG